MISVDGKVYPDYVKFPVTYNPKTDQEKQELIEEYRYLVDEATGKLLELIDDNIELIQDGVEYKLAKSKNDHIKNIINYIDWQYDLWSKHLKTEKEAEEQEKIV